MLVTYSSTLTVAIKFKNISNKFCQLLSGKSKSIKLHFYLLFQYAKMKKLKHERTTERTLKENPLKEKINISKGNY